MSIRNLIASVAFVCLLGCGADRSTRPPTYGLMVGHDFFGREGPRSDGCEVVAMKYSSSPPFAPRPDLVWFGTTFEGGRANPEEAKAFGDSIGATRCEFFESQVLYCGTGMTPAQMRALKPAYHTDYHFFGLPGTPIVRGFPPEWAYRCKAVSDRRGSVDGRAPVEIHDVRSSPQPTQIQTATPMVKIGDMPWYAGDEPLKERLVDFGRYLNADEVWILSEAAPAGDLASSESFARVYFLRRSAVHSQGVDLW